MATMFQRRTSALLPHPSEINDHMDRLAGHPRSKSWSFGRSKQSLHERQSCKVSPGQYRTERSIPQSESDECGDQTTRNHKQPRWTIGGERRTTSDGFLKGASPGGGSKEVNPSGPGQYDAIDCRVYKKGSTPAYSTARATETAAEIRARKGREAPPPGSYTAPSDFDGKALWRNGHAGMHTNPSPPRPRRRTCSQPAAWSRILAKPPLVPADFQRYF
eukprot:TRINITY_DN70322_c0_g1_i1.p1 TRINITY_DN70322_c0_g1~~TRINITY_DN70322_c0_g1_i1.p1  ORF type:complete len:218 (+),score=14.60 TRINITY_DN70322_c0_g1_i1:176-829(+)